MNRNIEIVVPYPPGGATDLVGRITCDILKEAGYTASVKNIPGENNKLGARYAAESNNLMVGCATSLGSNLADRVLVGCATSLGSNLVIVGGNFAEDNLGYSKDSFVPVAPVARTSFVLAVRSDLNINSYQEFVDYVTANPDKFRLGSWHQPTARVIMSWIARSGLPTPQVVSFTGSTPQLDAMVSGDIDFCIETWVAASTHHDNRELEVLAVLDQAGYDAIAKNARPPVVCLSSLYEGIDIDNWYGIVAPSSTDSDFVAELNRIITAGYQDEKYRQRLLSVDFRVWDGGADAFTATQEKTIEFYSKL